MACILFDHATSASTLEEYVKVDTTKAFPKVSSHNDSPCYLRLNYVSLVEIDDPDAKGVSRLYCHTDEIEAFSKIDEAIKAKILDKTVQNRLIDAHVLQDVFRDSCSDKGYFHGKFNWHAHKIQPGALTIQTQIDAMFLTPQCLYVQPDLTVGVVYDIAYIHISPPATKFPESSDAAQSTTT